MKIYINLGSAVKCLQMYNNKIKKKEITKVVRYTAIKNNPD